MHPKGYITTTLYCRVHEKLPSLKRKFGLTHMNNFYKDSEAINDFDKGKTNMATLISVAYWNIMQYVFNNNINMNYIRDYNSITKKGSKGQKLFLCIYKLGEKQDWEDCEYFYREPINWGYNDENKLMFKIKFVSFKPEWIEKDDVKKVLPDYMQNYKDKFEEMGMYLN